MPIIKKPIVSSVPSQTSKFYRSSKTDKSLASTISKKQPPSRSVAVTAAGGLRGKTSLMLANAPAGAAAIQDARVVYAAFKANNPLADVVLAYARISYEALDRQLSHLEVGRERSLRAATFADYAYGQGMRIELDSEVASASSPGSSEESRFLREGLIATAAMDLGNPRAPQTSTIKRGVQQTNNRGKLMVNNPLTRSFLFVLHFDILNARGNHPWIPGWWFQTVVIFHNIY